MAIPRDTPVPAVQRWGAVVWPSFFAAGVATMVFFAMFDPAQLSRIAWIGVEVDRKLGYTQRAGAKLAEWMKQAEGVAA